MIFHSQVLESFEFSGKSCSDFSFEILSLTFSFKHVSSRSADYVK